MMVLGSLVIVGQMVALVVLLSSAGESDGQFHGLGSVFLSPSGSSA